MIFENEEDYYQYLSDLDDYLEFQELEYLKKQESLTNKNMQNGEEKIIKNVQNE